jgi:methylenetetrahydrofolate dehydrogenase (NADP+)/methenyltetrahydrofolate cyclohydrolase
MGILLDGKALAGEIREAVQVQVESLISMYQVIPHLAVILVGTDPASQSYVKGKETACRKAGIKSTIIQKPDTITEAELLHEIDLLNADETVHGILLQLPIPKRFDPDKIIARIRKEKDVDGFTPENIAALYTGRPRLVPCTPLGVLKLLKKYEIPIQGKHCVIVGRSTIVGKPMAFLLLKENATISICHTKTKDLGAITRQADILVVATGQPGMIHAEHVSKGAVVIDVGISKVDGVISGDVDFASVEPLSSYITPVPGGVGPMTIACLLENTLTCYMNFVGEKHD